MGNGGLVSDIPEKDIGKLFQSLQNQMHATLITNSEVVSHPGTQGDGTELNWIKMLESYLPTRYKVAKAFVIDVDGKMSDQIDIVIFDRQYSPLIFNQNSAVYVPAESVYAVIEVKPQLSKATIEYAGKKAASVRQLRRTSAPIPHAGGKYEPKKPFEIPCGILTTNSAWNPALGDSFDKALISLKGDELLNFGCALEGGSFRVRANDKITIETSKPENALMFLFLNLLSILQDLGTVPAIDYVEYSKWLK